MDPAERGDLDVLDGAPASVAGDELPFWRPLTDSAMAMCDDLARTNRPLGELLVPADDLGERLAGEVVELQVGAGPQVFAAVVRGELAVDRVAHSDLDVTRQRCEGSGEVDVPSVQCPRVVVVSRGRPVGPRPRRADSRLEDRLEGPAGQGNHCVVPR